MQPVSLSMVLSVCSKCSVGHKSNRNYVKNENDKEKLETLFSSAE